MDHAAIILLAFTIYVGATGPVPIQRSGLAGIDGFTFYDPYCAHGCFRSFSPYKLQCSEDISPGGHTTLGIAAHNLAICRASDFPYLSSIAWCIHTFCPQHTLASTIESFWETEITGDVSILPQWSYGETLAKIKEPPVIVASDPKSLVLKTTMLTTYQTWTVTQDTLIYFFQETARESYYGLALLLTASALPIVLTWLGYLPYMTRTLSRIGPWLYASTFGSYHDRPLPLLIGNAPTVGQGGYIALLLILNIIFTTIGYRTLWPHEEMQWYSNHYQELMAYWMWRTGALAFCQMPVLFLFSTRNNILLWLSNWSHSTFMLLHRWIARFFLVQLVLHSILALVLYQNDGTYSSTVDTPLWIWGCVATVAAVILILTSFLIIRQRAYELFLITHIVMAVICLVGCWYHVWADDQGDFGYETWLYATFAVWFFDRLTRVGRILKTGIRRARITDVTPTIVRVDIPGIRWNEAGRCGYVYFPTLDPFRPWENHPFSLIPTPVLDSPRNEKPLKLEIDSIGKGNFTAVQSSSESSNMVCRSKSGVTLFIRKRGSMTRLLQPQKNLFTLMEGPYPTTSVAAILNSDRLLLIGGGIGITGLLPYVGFHPSIKLLYSVKKADEGLVAATQHVLDRLADREVVIGGRVDISARLQEEVDIGWSKIAVIACGPAGLCDDVRAIVAWLGRSSAHQCTLELQIDAFSR